jgi:hypothetical protein
MVYVYCRATNFVALAQHHVVKMMTHQLWHHPLFNGVLTHKTMSNVVQAQFDTINMTKTTQFLGRSLLNQ